MCSLSIWLLQHLLSQVLMAETNGDNYIKNGETARAIFTTSENLHDTYASNTKQIAGNTASLSNVGNTYTATYAIGVAEATISEGHLAYGFQIADYAGNLSNSIANASSTLIYDRTVPVVTNVLPVDGTEINGTQAISFSASDANAGTTQVRFNALAYENFTSGNGFLISNNICRFG